MKPSSTIHVGDCREVMATMPERHFHCCVTSPPYFGLRDYGHDGQIGLEPTPDDFVAAMVEVFRGVWRVLRDDGVLWLNVGDSYNGSGKGGGGEKQATNVGSTGGKPINIKSMKPKDLIGIPWRVAFALQADGWYLRDAIIWHKPAPMPGSQRDRCTSSYEFIFQLTKKPKYFFDMEAVKERSSGTSGGACFGKREIDAGGTGAQQRAVGGDDRAKYDTTRIPRNVWKIAHEGFKDAHFATFPSELPTRCIKASTSKKGCCPTCGAAWVRIVEKARTFESGSGKSGQPINGKQQAVHGGGETGDIRKGPCVTSSTVGWEPGCKCQINGTPPVPCRVLDPFNGAGTTGVAANLLGHDYEGCELNPEYAQMARERIAKALNPTTARSTKETPAPLFAG